MPRISRVLIIAGSDSGGGAGIQADIKTVTMLGGHAMTAITAITAQNTLGVQAVLQIPTEMVLKQMDVVLDDLGADVVKIGMIGSAETAEAVAARLERMSDVPVVFDPVMVATSGSLLADDATVKAFERLMGIAALVTPNVPELQALGRMEIASGRDRDKAAAAVMKRTGCRALLAKGGHALPDQAPDEVRDFLYRSDGSSRDWRGPRIDTVHTHGTGCTLASAIATELGKDRELAEAISLARDYVQAALLAAPAIGAGHGPMGHGLGISPFEHIHSK
jgi:hydroxymethylpyrimidine/phosphomethylpyrimidine kinase